MKKLLPLTIFMIFAAIAVFLMLDWGDAPELSGSNTDDTQHTARNSDIELEELAQPDDEPAKANDAESLMTPDKEKPETEDESLEPELHSPDYGPLLRRGGGKVDFKLVDANGRECELRGNGWVYLYRQLGKHWLKESARVNGSTNRIECHGHAPDGQRGVGLEPGRYELDFHSGEWGSQRHSFVVDRNEVRSDTLYSSHYLRRVSFLFEDQNGNPIPWINAQPYVYGSRTPLTKVDRISAENNFLVVPPNERLARPDGQPGLGGGIGLGGGASKSLFPTKDGRWYVNVWAGAECTVSFRFDKSIWGVENVRIKDTFTAAKWNIDHVVVLDVPDSYKTKAGTEMVVDDTFSPGHELETLSVLARISHPELGTEIRKGHARLYVNIEDEIFGTPVIRGYGSYFRDYKFIYIDSQWVADVPAGQTVYLAIAIGEQVWHCEKVALEEGQTKVVSISPPAFRPNMSTKGLPMTLLHGALGFEWMVHIDGESPDQFRVSFDRSGQKFIRRGFMTEGRFFDEHDFKNFGSSIRFYTIKREDGSFNKWTWSSGFGDPTRQEGSISDLLELIKDRDWADDFSGHIFLRVVGDDKEGLPWTQGIIQPFEDDKVAQQIRSKSLLEDGSKLSIDIKDYESSGYESKWDDLNPDTDEYDKNLASLVGKKNAKVLTTTEERLWFAKYGAWYKSDSKVYSDDHGYIHGDHDLIPGELYVLYLWSNSRNDLEPDRRIVFKAGEKHTDLGVVRISSYR